MTRTEAIDLLPSVRSLGPWDLLRIAHALRGLAVDLRADEEAGQAGYVERKAATIEAAGMRRLGECRRLLASG